MTETLQVDLQKEIADRRARILACSETRACDIVSDGTPTRGRVLEAAIGLFAEREFEACTMKRLAAEAGIQAPALYNYFTSKEQILSEALWLALKDFYQAVLQNLEDESLTEWLPLIVRRHAVCTLESGTIARASGLLLNRRMLALHLAADEYREFKEVIAEYIRLLRDLMRAGALYEMSREEGTVAAYAVASMCDHAGKWYHRSGRLSTEEVADAIAVLVLQMLQAR